MPHPWWDIYNTHDCWYTNHHLYLWGKHPPPAHVNVTLVLVVVKRYFVAQHSRYLAVLSFQRKNTPHRSPLPVDEGGYGVYFVSSYSDQRFTFLVFVLYAIMQYHDIKDCDISSVYNESYWTSVTVSMLGFFYDLCHCLSKPLLHLGSGFQERIVAI